MEYIAKVNDREYGPVAEEVLAQWVEDGRVLIDTPVRNSMMRIWKNAGDLPFLRASFEKQSRNFNIDLGISYDDNKTRVIKIKNPLLAEDKTEIKKSTEFKNKLLPDKAGILLRLKAGIIDFIIVIFIFVFSFFIGTYFIPLPVFAAYTSFSLWFFLILLYFGGCIGVFAQTLGMWFYGIILVRNGDDAQEVYLLRAYIYALLILIVGIFSPVFNFISGRKRSLHDLLTDTQVVKISARKSE